MIVGHDDHGKALRGAFDSGRIYSDEFIRERRERFFERRRAHLRDAAATLETRA